MSSVSQEDEACKDNVQAMISALTPRDNDAKLETKQLNDSTISAAPSQLMPPALTKQCACRANCGSTACERAKKDSTIAKNQWGVFLVDQRWA